MFDYEKRSPMDYGLYNAMYGEMWPTHDRNITNMSGPTHFQPDLILIDLVTGLEINNFYFHWSKPNETALNLLK